MSSYETDVKIDTESSVKPTLSVDASFKANESSISDSLASKEFLTGVDVGTPRRTELSHSTHWRRTSPSQIERFDSAMRGSFNSRMQLFAKHLFFPEMASSWKCPRKDDGNVSHRTKSEMPRNVPSTRLALSRNHCKQIVSPVSLN